MLVEWADPDTPQAVMKYHPAGNGKTGRPLERHLDCNVETGTATRFKSLQA